MSARNDSTPRCLDTAKPPVHSPAMPDAVLLRAERLTRAYGSLLAVSDVDVSVRRGELRSIIGPNRAAAILKSIGLASKLDMLAAHLSHGEKRHLELAIALASDPTLLLLDEPTAGMSPEETDSTMGLIRELAAGRTVVLVEHKMKVVMRISDRVTVLHQGRVLAEGTPDEIRANERVQQTYLGSSR